MFVPFALCEDLFKVLPDVLFCRLKQFRHTSCLIVSVLISTLPRPSPGRGGPNALAGGLSPVRQSYVAR